MAESSKHFENKSLKKALDYANRNDLALRKVTWSAYAVASRAAKKSASPMELANVLSSRVMAGQPYDAVTLGLKLAQLGFKIKMRKQGAPSRVKRAIVEQFFHVARVQFRANLGLRAGFQLKQWEWGSWDESKSWSAYTDGSLLATGAGFGAVLQSPDSLITETASIALIADNALNSEISGLVWALETLATLNAKHVHIKVDCEDVLVAMQGRLPLRHCLLEAKVLSAMQHFDGIKVTLIPRMFNYHADRLAAKAANSATGNTTSLSS